MTTGDASVNGGLSQEQLDFLRASLERLRMDLRARLEREQGTAREAEPQVEPIDAAEQTREQDDAISFAERDRARRPQPTRTPRPADRSSSHPGTIRSTRSALWAGGGRAQPLSRNSDAATQAQTAAPYRRRPSL